MTEVELIVVDECKVEDGFVKGKSGHIELQPARSPSYIVDWHEH